MTFCMYLALKPKSNAVVLKQDLDKLAKWDMSCKTEFHPEFFLGNTNN